MNVNKSKKDKLKKSRFSWIEYIGMLVAMGVLAAMPAVIFGAEILLGEPYVILYVLYWSIISGIFCAITAYTKHVTFDKPMRSLSDATAKVASGDFSVYLAPIHSIDKRDYIDVMFEDFNKMVEELGSIETLKNDFIGNVSHEIKTPLSIIKNYASILKKKNLDESEREQYIETIIGAADNLTALVTNILKLSKLENQDILPVTESYDLCRQLSDIAMALEKPLEDKNIELEVEMDDRLLIKYDPGMLELVWHNLLSNAVKFTPSNGKITFTQIVENGVVKVTVSDTGCGMTPESVRHIFDKFYQSDISHSGVGNGLGLALVWRVLELVGGDISVKSKLGEGSSFTVKLVI